MQAKGALRERFQALPVEDNVIGQRQPLLAARLRGHDRLDLGPIQASPSHDTGDLQCNRAVDHQHAVEILCARCAFGQQRDIEHEVRGGRSQRPGQLAGALPDHRMKQRLQALPRSRIGKYPGPDRAAVQRAVRADRLVAELGAQRPDRGPAGGGQFVRNRIRIDQGRTLLDQHPPQSRFAGADTSGQRDGQRVVHRKLTSSRATGRSGPRTTGPGSRRPPGRVRTGSGSRALGAPARSARCRPARRPARTSG